MAPFPDEVDVFSAPHWRMKKLVNLYSEKLSKTNFSNSRDFQALLTSLYATFTEFKSHEQIENECIMEELQQRLRALSVRNSSVSTVHSDNKLSDMLRLFEKGLKNIKNEYEQLNYSRQLKERLDAFTKEFIPHMKEEEEVFQPLLMEYFTYEELKDIKTKVIAQHRSQGQVDPVHVPTELPLWGQSQEAKLPKNAPGKKARKDPQPEVNNTHVSQLPPELLLKILGYLNPRELCRSRQVNTRWARVARTGALWRHLHPVSWARGHWYNGPPSSVGTGPDRCWDEDLSRARRWDEDADVDESEEDGHRQSAQREGQLLQGLMHHVLPQVGPSVRSLVLAYSTTVSSQMVRQILSACPRLEHLDLTQTPVTDSAFNRCAPGSCRSLQHLDLSGCDRITDTALLHLSRALGELPVASVGGEEEEEEQEEESGAHRDRCCWVSLGCTDCLPAEEVDHGTQDSHSRVWLLPQGQLLDIEEAGELKQRGVPAAPPPAPAACLFRGLPLPAGAELSPRAGALRSLALHSGGRGQLGLLNRMVWSRGSEAGGSPGHRKEAQAEGGPLPRSLRFLSLSGCYHVTDQGLRALTRHGGLPLLQHLDLSGCLLVTGPGLQELVSACPTLNDEFFFYCDNISGPHANTASGCQNLQCSGRACCRSGE
ncbi:LOW QUALITY PROTEIN: F-box/LRR-repeat protein 5 [Hemitrygon akajei]|uniref:LOW QUALITY PROTEIN: F-box/LRR-repeat protein 5 n=1 Tax=Hemitrygon akajei TaxID=2704970 RepID=UPI003BF99E77